MLFIVAIYILYEAWERLMRPPEIESVAMLIIAAIGLAVNFLSMRLLATGKDKSLDMKGAYLEVWSDMLGSLGVIVGALLIYFTGWTQIDPLIAIAIALWVLPRTYVLLKESRSEEHTSELQSLMRTSYDDFCLKIQNINLHTHINNNTPHKSS